MVWFGLGWVFETGSLYCPGTFSVDQSGLELKELLPKLWDQRRVPPHPATSILGERNTLKKNKKEYICFVENS